MVQSPCRDSAATVIDLAAEGCFDFQSDEYRNLLRSADATAFQHPDWLTSFYRHCAVPGEVEPLIVVGRATGSGDLCLVAPLLKRRTGGSVTLEHASLGVTDYACVVATPDIRPACRDRPEISRQFSDIVDAYGALRIEPIRSEHLPLWQALVGGTTASMAYRAHELTFGSPFRQWRPRSFGRARASGLDRKARRLAEYGSLRLEVATGYEVRRAILQVRDFRGSRFVDDPLHRPAMLDFYSEVAERGQRSGLSRTYRLACADGTIAILFGLIQGARFCYLLLGCDYPTYGKYSPGLVMLDMVMAAWAAEGGAIFDFTVGDEPFKADFGCEAIPMYRLSR